MPIESVRGFTDQGVVKKSLQMALSSCQPVKENIFKQRFPNDSLFEGYWQSIFKGLEKRGLIAIDEGNKVISLTPVGQTLVEAIIHTELG